MRIFRHPFWTALGFLILAVLLFLIGNLATKSTINATHPHGGWKTFDGIYWPVTIAILPALCILFLVIGAVVHFTHRSPAAKLS